MVFSMELVRRIVLECESCRCAAIDQPDDMVIGAWLKRLGVPLSHSPLFHQVKT